ncbi:hypothetical protein N0V88_002755 [Collariella sp. IMI 366227]|nr:hypothetical protein N0V88_002755 [Collariella sp. IMI 366227]
MPPQPLLLAILEADTPHLLSRAVSPPLPSLLSLTGHDVVANPSSAYPPLDSIDAILITGSKYNAFDDEDWILTLVEETLNIQQMHRDQVFSVPAGAELLASTDKCMNHGFLVPKKVITVQGHPEFTEDIMQEILELRHESGLLTDEVYQSGTERNGDHHDGVFMAQVFVKFLQEQ